MTFSRLKIIKKRNNSNAEKSAQPSRREIDELTQYSRQRKYRELLVTCESLSQKYPTDPVILNFQGLSYAGLKQFDQALNCYIKALEFKPDYAEAYCNIGIVLNSMRRPTEAIRNFREALNINPGYSAAQCNLGNAFVQIGSFDEAIACYYKALDVEPDSAPIHYNLGVALHTSGKFREATISYRRAIALNPAYATAYNNLGISLRFLGEISEAANCFRKAISISPDFADAHRHLSNTIKFDTHNEDVRAMEKSYAKTDLNEPQKMLLSFALGKAFEDLRQYEKAFEYFQIGNLLKRKTFDFSIDGAMKVIKRINQTFSSDLILHCQGVGLSDHSPIFVVGMPRSGTTLVEQILSSHRDVIGGGELPYLQQVVSSQFKDISDAKLKECILSSSPEKFSEAGKQYIELIRQYSQNAKYITDKTPLNFHLIGMIKLILPQAKIVHCCRDSRDTCMSIYRNYFEVPGNLYAYQLDELGHYYNLYVEQMVHWHSVFPNEIYDIQYEKLIHDQESQTRSLLKYCDLDWDDACLEFHKNKREVQTASATQVRKPLYSNSVELWKRYEKWLGPLLESLEYH